MTLLSEAHRDDVLTSGFTVVRDAVAPELAAQWRAGLATLVAEQRSVMTERTAIDDYMVHNPMLLDPQFDGGERLGLGHGADRSCGFALATGGVHRGDAVVEDPERPEPAVYMARGEGAVQLGDQQVLSLLGGTPVDQVAGDGGVR